MSFNPYQKNEHVMYVVGAKSWEGVIQKIETDSNGHPRIDVYYPKSHEVQTLNAMEVATNLFPRKGKHRQKRNFSGFIDPVPCYHMNQWVMCHWHTKEWFLAEIIAIVPGGLGRPTQYHLRWEGRQWHRTPMHMVTAYEAPFLLRIPDDHELPQKDKKVERNSSRTRGNVKRGGKKEQKAPLHPTANDDEASDEESQQTSRAPSTREKKSDINKGRQRSVVRGVTPAQHSSNGSSERGRTTSVSAARYRAMSRGPSAAPAQAGRSRSMAPRATSVHRMRLRSMAPAEEDDQPVVQSTSPSRSPSPRPGPSALAVPGRRTSSERRARHRSQSIRFVIDPPPIIPGKEEPRMRSLGDVLKENEERSRARSRSGARDAAAPTGADDLMDDNDDEPSTSRVVGRGAKAIKRQATAAINPGDAKRVTRAGRLTTLDPTTDAFNLAIAVDQHNYSEAKDLRSHEDGVDQLDFAGRLVLANASLLALAAMDRDGPTSNAQAVAVDQFSDGVEQLVRFSSYVLPADRAILSGPVSMLIPKKTRSIPIYGPFFPNLTQKCLHNALIAFCCPGDARLEVPQGLTLDALRSLAPGKDVSPLIIDSWLRLFCHFYHQINYCTAVSCSFFTSISSNTPRWEELSRVQFCQETKKKGDTSQSQIRVVYIPVKIEDHWILAIADKTTATVYVADSAPEKTAKTRGELMKTLRAALQVTHGGIRWKAETIMSSKQTMPKDSGIFLLMNAWNFALSRELIHPRWASAHFRARAVQQLLQNDYEAH